MGNGEGAEPTRFFAHFAAFLAIAIGLLVFAGWIFDIESFINLVPNWPRMAQLTALTFIFAGAALWLTSIHSRRLAPMAAAIVAMVGIAMLARDFTGGWDIQLERFTRAVMRGQADGPEPTPMASAAAIAFALFGVSLLCARTRRFAHVHQGLAIACMLMGWLGFSRYVFGSDAAFVFASMAAHTAVLLILLSAGALTLRRDTGISALLASEGVGGAMARRLLPVAIVVPLLAGAFAIRQERSGTFGVGTAISIFALISVIAFVAFVWINAARGERADRLRREAERALRLSEERTQLIVETALDAVVTMNVHGLITGWNTQAERTFGWTRAEALGRELAELIIPEPLRSEHRLGMRRYIETGVARVLNKRIEVTGLHRDGREFPVELAVTPNGFGKELMFNAFIRDITGRTRGEAALRESEQRFRTTANAAPVLIWMSGADKKCTWFNQRWLDFVGRSMEQEIGDGWCDNVHPADFDRTLDTYHAAFDARRPYEMEYRLQRDDGAWRWLLERGTPNIGPNGAFEGYIGTCIDITEHRETLEQLRESRARFKTLTESLPQMIWTCLRDGYCDYLSRQWLDYTGRSEAQQLGAGWLEQVHPDDRVKVRMEWARVVGTGDTYDIMFRIRRFDGVYRWFKTRAVPLRDPAGRILKWFGSNTDIEDFVVSEHKLKVQLERMQLLDRATHAIGTHQQEARKVFEVVLSSLESGLDIDFGILCTYQAEPELLTVSCVGERSAEIAKRIGLAELASIEIDPDALARCLRGELVYEPDVSESRFPFPARLATGGLRSVVAAPLLIENEVLGVLVVAKRAPDAFSSDDCEFLRQLSSHVALAAHGARLYAALQGAYQDLRQTQQTVMQQERLRALGQIASGIAHDINNALSPAALYVQTIRIVGAGARTARRDPARHRGRRAHRAAHACVLPATRARAHAHARRREPGAAAGRRPHARALDQHSAGARRRRARRERSGAGLAEDAGGGERGARCVHQPAAERRRRAARRRRVDARGEQIVVEFKDNGIGMNETTRSRCLEPFFTTKGERGTGLGLAVVFGMVQRHGGDLEIDSELGKGTTMRLSFPRAPHGLTGEQPVLKLPARPLRILLVDDDPLLLRSLRDALELDAHEVVTAEGGQAGIDTFSAEIKAGKRFDAVITDLGMPYVDGRKVASRIRAMAGHVPIIMLTGWGHRMIATDDRPEHVDRVISKPPKMAELRSVLAELVRADESR
jgi:PAS domain S-box-containing protein